MYLNCLFCNKLFDKPNNLRKYCGSRRIKNSCSYKQMLLNTVKSNKKLRDNGGFRKRILNPLVDRRSKLKKFGLTLEDYELLLKNQNGVCAICKNRESSKMTSNLSVDHSHETGKVRGLLCARCNAGLGLLKDDIGCLQNAISYLIINKKLN